MFIVLTWRVTSGGKLSQLAPLQHQGVLTFSDFELCLTLRQLSGQAVV